MTSFILGSTSSGLPIPGFRFGSANSPEVLILGGVHGDEPEGVEAAVGLVQKWLNHFPFRLRITIAPMFNFDGVLRSTRGNANGVDLNRNMATNDWSPEVKTPRYHPGPRPGSEKETQVLVDWLNAHAPVFVLSLHSWKPMLNVNGDCRREAQAIVQWTGYEIEETVGYPTPGCLGTYCGLERDIPTLTYEIERGLKTATILNLHLQAIEEGLKVTESIRQKSL